MQLKEIVRLIILVVTLCHISACDTPVQEKSVQRVDIPLRFINKGEFTMGEKASEHRVIINYDFWMGRYEVSQDEYQRITGDNPVASDAMRRYYASMNMDPDKQVGKNIPVVRVSWSEANNFAILLSNRAKSLNMLPDGYVYRLPTEAEWEYCCRAGGAVEQSNSYELHKRSHYVEPYDNPPFNLYINGSRVSNEWGLFDMVGFVSEWCFDYYAPLDSKTATNPTGPVHGQQRVVRGGYGFDTKTYTSSYRYTCPNTSPHRGFRVVLAPSIDSLRRDAK